jgi:cellulose synthase/poly-beta-1,6-N-acetylglucosamine synthase-like glycosyltransferase
MVSFDNIKHKAQDTGHKTQDTKSDLASEVLGLGSIDCSVVVPLYNESSVVQELYDRLTKSLISTGLSYELIFIDDGSKDNTL